MGYFFEVAAELGADPKMCESLRRFGEVSWTLSDRTIVSCVYDPSASNLWRAIDENWWCRVSPKGVSITGAVRSVSTESMLVELARHMYETLRECSGFRFARIGWEVAESVEISELVNGSSGAEAAPPGLVVSANLWQRMGSPADFIPFGKQTFWKPLSEENYASLVRLWE